MRRTIRGGLAAIGLALSAPAHAQPDCASLTRQHDTILKEIAAQRAAGRDAASMTTEQATLLGVIQAAKCPLPDQLVASGYGVDAATCQRARIFGNTLDGRTIEATCDRANWTYRLAQ